MYPYAEWLSGRSLKLERGIDYHASTRKVIEGIRRYAKRHELDYVIAQRGDSIYIKPTTGSGKDKEN